MVKKSDFILVVLVIGAFTLIRATDNMIIQFMALLVGLYAVYLLEAE